MLIILFIQNRAYALFQNLSTFLLLTLLLPFNLLKILPALLWNILTSIRAKLPGDEKPKNILITGAKMSKSLQLARSFNGAGHRVFLLETHKYWLSGNRFSNAIKDFYTVPNSEKNWDGYQQAVLEIVQKENINLFIPVSSAAGSYDESRLKAILSPYCEVFHFDLDITELLDNKFTFIEKAKSLGLSVPKSFLMTDSKQILDFDFVQDGSRYILKSIPYDSVRRLDMTKLPMKSEQEMEEFVKELPITEDKPWIMQEFVQGKEYCTHSTVRKGKIRLYCCCESSEFQVNYNHVEEPEIYQWVKTFVRALNLTGQISFDFIKTEDGQVYPIECNPRTHSAITTFHDHPGVADAYLKDVEDETKSPIFPLPDSKPTYWTYHELWRLTQIRSFGQFKAWIKRMIEGTDGIFQPHDPLPFLMVHHWQIPLLILQNLKTMKGWVRIDFNIGKLVELDGD
ncbi:MAG: ATP-grasp domain-containing protein [Roseofilum sp. SBFL]|uniref:ATP-grasp domain-containing protein n=1 Tax=unclassified Roseofilum TaxID=2620099 RepID=UPI001B225916|nr:MULTISPECIES: ATP-grasp domain-containing protein [unclassified Roseofilum]MBP0013106.1 ATP-grasp domain-containing protein [Roseofilum sp. SID3]MBP0023726.1 ATP-grasp domain-containing protein [Roseofilum sp. SID2]MBP0036798.1 ATP-grasp domain-containing protein [Roseofilum sp. SID1]MBP0042588.1 ATP-grasp domain-containing protein [Roseofilum sp. SBFL]